MSSVPLPNARLVERLAPVALAFVCAAVFLAAIHPVANPDFGWHVAVGRWIAAHGAVPDADPFSHTARGAPMVAQAWAGELAYALAIDAVGVRGLRFAHGALAAATCALLFYWMRRAGARPSLALFLTVVWVVVAASRFQVRPYVFNLPLFMTAFGALFVARPALGRAQLAGFFGLTALWANLHPGATLFVAVVWLYAAAATVERRALGRAARADDPGRGRLSRLWALAAVVSLALLATPNGARLLPYLVETRRVNAGLSLEWFSIASPQAVAVHGPLVLACLGALCAAAVAFAWRRRREVPLARLAVVLAVSALPLVGQRFTWASFVPALFVAESLAAEGRARGAAERAGSAAVPAALLAAALALAAYAFAADLAPERVRRRATDAANFATGMFPTDAVTFLAETGLEGNLFNDNRWGGYVLFRTHDRFPVFVDGRWITLGEDVVREARRVSLRRQGFEDVLARREVEIVLVPRGWITDALRGDPGWRTAFENFNGGVYLRRGPSFDANLARCAAYYAARGIPFDPAVGFRERDAIAANPRWAARMHVQRMQLHEFGRFGVRAFEEEPRWVAGWPAAEEPLP